MPNIVATRYSTLPPILSPLIGLDKVEIEKIAKKIGTYEISIIPEISCSAAPRHPETNVELPQLLRVFKTLNAENELEKVTSSIKLLKK